jgi:flagellin-like hook-associated protein FlgL
VFFFVQSRRTWEERASALRDRIQEQATAAAAREESLRKEIAARDLQVAERKAEAQSIARIADKTLEELKASLEDLRQMREANALLEAEYREAIRREESFLARALERWVPEWIRAASTAPRPDGTETEGQ